MALLLGKCTDAGALYPLVLGAVSIIASIIGTFFVKTKEGGSVMGALYKGVIISGVIAAIAFYPVTNCDDERVSKAMRWAFTCPR